MFFGLFVLVFVGLVLLCSVLFSSLVVLFWVGVVLVFFGIGYLLLFCWLGCWWFGFWFVFFCVAVVHWCC